MNPIDGEARLPVTIIAGFLGSGKTLGVGHFPSDRYGSGQLDRDNAHLTNDGFEWLSFEAQRPFAAEKFQSFLEQLSVDVFRAKGVLWIAESEKRYVFHLVGQRFTLDESQWARPAKSRLVLIGRDLDHKGLRARLEACLARPSIRV
jgi:G3E family GTPase